MKQEGKRPGLMTRVRGKRDWVKNAIIIFLAILLVLTFFSNTIMNYSLPEVAAQYPQSTTITTKIRGSGTVEAAQTYNVTVEETRTVASVSVKAGDKVQAGDTLLVLDETESQELTDARTAYNALKLEYDKMQIDKGDQSHAAAASLQQARDAVSRAETDLANARQYESDLSWYQDQVSSAESALSARNQEKTDADNLVSSLTNQLSAVESGNSEYLQAKERLENAQIGGDLEEIDAALAEKERIYNEQIAPRTAELNQQLLDAQASADSASARVSSAQAALDQANSALSQFQSSSSGALSVSAAQDALQSAQDALASAEAAAADTEAQESYEDQVAQREMEAKAQELQDAEEKVKALEEKTAAAKIVSRYAGVVQSVNIAAGDTTSAETPLMVVELTEKGYTLSATVTRDQARLLREGLSAEVTNLWDSGITMTLTSITADKTDPSGSRTLTFSIQGEDVTVGQQLAFSIGDKNASYDVVVPSSAIHTDADGSFVYTVTVKSSPLGNRYTVRRTTVEVIASDDTSSAVTGGLSTADFVITTSAVPLEPGDQVRIAE